MEAKQVSKKRQPRVKFVRGADGITRTHRGTKAGRPVSIDAKQPITFRTSPIVGAMLQRLSDTTGVAKSEILRRGIQLFHEELVRLGSKEFKKKYLS